jgi:predicted TIM-barrel fold metal-dependent hydrolase
MTPPRPAPRIIDTHAHVFSMTMPLAEGAWHTPAAEADAEQYLHALDEHGVESGVLAGASISGTNNDYPLAACDRHPRLRTTVIVAPDCPLPALQDMARRGAVGVRFQLRNVARVPDFASVEYRGLLRHIAELGWHVQLHDDARRLPDYLPALEAAGVDVVVDHFGRPDLEDGIAGAGFQRLLRSIDGGRTWVKLSSAFRLGSDDLVMQAATALIACAGPQRLMWGSDWPFAAFESRVTYTQVLNDLCTWVPDSVTRHRIAFDTPNLFYRPRHDQD